MTGESEVKNFIIQNGITNKYVRSTDYTYTEFEYVENKEDATVFNKNDITEDELFPDNLDRLYWKIRPIILKFEAKRDLFLSTVEADVLYRLSLRNDNTILNKDMLYSEVMDLLGLDPDFNPITECYNQADIQQVCLWVARNFVRAPKIGDKMCVVENGRIISRAHKVVSVDMGSKTAWISGRQGGYKFEDLELDLEEY